MSGFAAGLALLLAGIPWRIITHFFILCVCYLTWSNLIFYNLYFLVAIQYMLIIVTYSYYILGFRWGLFYSVCNIVPFVLLILYYVQQNAPVLEKVSNGPSFSIVLVFNFALLVTIHYYFLKAFRESGDKEKELFANLEASLSSLQLLMAKKDEFLGLATHELKTPITSMKASLQSLQGLVSKNDSLKETVPLLTIANRQVVKLSALVSDLVDVSKIQSGQMEMNSSSFVLSTVIADCIAEMEHQAKNYQFNFFNDVDSQVIADKARIEQVVINLLLNAVKYSPVKRVINVIIEADGLFVKVSVRDEGIGIPADKLPFIFDRFFRVHDSSQIFSGLGMGLFICADIVRRHGGKIGVESKEGVGSLFWFSLPKNGVA
jgi:signal transduction histidine kinase